MQKYLNILQKEFFRIYNTNREKGLISTLLSFISKLFFVAYKSRLLLYKLNILKKRTLPVSVISIGNLTTGGTGKTPLTIEIANYLINKGHKVGILSRGYRRSNEIKDLNKTILVSDGQDIVSDYELTGDEPYLIAKKVPKAIVVVNNDRIKAGTTAIKLGAEVLILDDGFQYLKLNRNENILLLDAYKPFDNGFLLPRGHLREYPDSMSRATAIVISNASDATISEIKESDLQQIKTFSKDKPIIKMKYKIRRLTGLNIKKSIDINELTNMKVVVFCGIGNPISFLDTLKSYKINIAQHLSFPDHFKYTYEEIKQITKLAQNHNTENIITTEKDAIKIETLCEAAPVTFWQTEIEIEWSKPNPLDTILSNTT